MASFVVGPWDVDPTLVGGYVDGAMAIDGPQALAAELPAELADVGRRHGVISGFTSMRGSDTLQLRNMVLRFADETTAQAAASDFAAVAATRTVPIGPIVAVDIPGNSATAAFSNPVDDESFGRRVTYVRAFTAHGPYVLYQLAVAVGGSADAVPLVARTLERQRPLIDGFTLTAPALLDTVPSDPTGLLARSLPTPAEKMSATRPGVYDPRGALHFQTDPIASSGQFAEVRLQEWALAGTGVYQLAEPGPAGRLADDFVAEVGDQGQPSAPVPGVPGSRCLAVTFASTGKTAGYCVAAAGRYVIESEEPTPADAQRTAGAQYELLVRP